MTFETYWILFVKDHARFGTQLAHVMGNLFTLSLVAAAVSIAPWWLIFTVPAPALLLARISHRYIERNKPLNALENPLYFLRCELRMVVRFFSGAMSEEVKKAGCTTSETRAESNEEAAAPRDK